MQTMKQVAGFGVVQHQYFYRASEAGEGTPVRVANTGQPVLVLVKPDATTTARIEYTISEPALVDAGTAIWLAWEEGDVSVVTSSALTAGISAVRVVGSAGVTWEVTS